MHCTVFHDPNFSLTIRKYHCKVCGTAVLGKENIMKHAAEMHDGKGAYQCQYCKKVSLMCTHSVSNYEWQLNILSFVMWEWCFFPIQVKSCLPRTVRNIIRGNCYVLREYVLCIHLVLCVVASKCTKWRIGKIVFINLLFLFPKLLNWFWWNLILSVYIKNC